ncbi:hypothetical protein [Spirosoma fluviale]|uniref:Uncharacterized protein n=1 Tax=Spirosoma fluviale TaxID=1597977 RepID=A0A286GU94_9BACT|nr:hypothetical protein [Spirosoma fluviale]SOD98554.1 hypothetical protein SAMN06269250_6146 [Spirosoma fluviale]
MQAAQAPDEARYYLVNLDPTPKADKPGKYNDYPLLTAGNFRGAKGGWLPSHSTSFEFGSGDFGYVISCNSVGQSDVKTDWLRNIDGQGNWWEVDPNSVMGVAQAHDWGTIDLFNDYQMPAFGTSQSGSIGKASQIKLPTMVLQAGGTHKLEQDTMVTMMQQADSARMASKRFQPA